MQIKKSEIVQGTEKEFLKVFNQLSYYRNFIRWEAWVEPEPPKKQWKKSDFLCF